MKFFLVGALLPMFSLFSQDIRYADAIPKGDFQLKPLPADMVIKGGEQNCGDFFVTTAHPSGGLAVIFKYQTLAPTNVDAMGAFSQKKFQTVMSSRFKVPSVELVGPDKNPALVTRVIVHISPTDLKKATPCIPAP